MINRKFDLDCNDRNTAEILRAARAFSVPPGSGMQGVLGRVVHRDVLASSLVSSGGRSTITLSTNGPSSSVWP
jgi:hypothetical protein